ncbi:hypothetical protein OSH11_21665 [Kaistia dalseonensis]|uniref:Uncharacterized protein n=1 Tax=Kaistia dalseonensis TaxID=410840 RepID=A0ABU0HCB8_9HYPH|nr:hypothetical protein [Kaistia dalseonensis]MCX5497320.1 hypothetical protein [Kaistia dalseonensis]MDQ0439957.1 hypothetical protein [Kaistia dalseonensis]
MVATSDQMTPRRAGDAYGYPVKAATRIFARTLVAVTATGLAVPAGTVGAVAVVGVAGHHADNRLGPDADGKIRVDREVFTFAFAGTAPTFANIGSPVYAVDDNTVSLDSSSGTRLKAGTLDGIEDGTPWVRV